MWLTAFGAFIGAVLSLVISIIIEFQRKPKLFFRVEQPPLILDLNQQQAKKGKFLRVILWNKAIPSYFKWLGREAAMHCNAEITILYHDDLTPVYKNPFPARWAGSDQPISPQIHPKTGEIVTLFDVAKYNAASRRNCYPGSKETIDVVARFDDDEDCYVWNNEVFINGWKINEHKIPKGRYYVIVSVYSAGEKTNGYFKLENSVSMNDFRLLEISKGEIIRIIKES